MLKVSVIMPIYNSEKYLDVALESLLNQSLRDIEIICVDDGSTDDSMKLLRMYQERDKRIKILQQKHSYAGVARNYGMSVAKGKYLSFLDSDDYFYSEMLEKVYLNAERENADIVIFGGQKFCDDIQSPSAYSALLKEELLPEGDSFDNRKKIDNLLFITTPVAWNKLFRREFVQRLNLNFQTTKRANDAYFVELAIAQANSIGIVRENLILYRIGNKESLQGSIEENPMEFVKVFADIQSTLIKWKLYDKVDKGFRNVVLAACIGNLDALSNMSSGAAFEELYLALNKEIFQYFHIDDMSKNDWINSGLYKQYLYVISHTPVEYLMNKCEKMRKNGVKKQYLFPYQRVPSESRIILYGGGEVGRTFYRQLKKSRYCFLESWVDQRVREYGDCRLYPPEQIEWNCADYIVIAMEEKNVAESIKKKIHETYMIPYKKIIWEYPLV